MDLFSHALLAFILGQALQLETTAQILLIISSVILDIDAILTLGGWEAGFKYHRGYLHSFLSGAVISLVIGILCTVFIRVPEGSFTSIVLVCSSGSFSHIFLDLLTTGDMAVLWPFSRKKVAFNLSHFIDPIFLGTVLLASIFIVYAKNDVNAIQTITIVAILCLTLNFAVRGYRRRSNQDQ